MISLRTTWILLLFTVLAACSANRTTPRIDYEKAKTTAPLDVPPPLHAPAGGPDAVEMPKVTDTGAASLLPEFSNVRMQRAGDMRWLVVDAEPEQIWPRVHEFLAAEGLKIKSEDAKLGIIETEWAENRADIPQSFIRDVISKVAPKLYEAATRDKYRVRLERGELAKTTEIYLSHYGLEQINKDDEVVWQPRPSDPELVTEMLDRLMLKLGIPKARAQAVLSQQKALPPAAQFDGGTLLVPEGFPLAWRLVGIALDRVGLVVEDLDRSKGIYYVRQSETFKLPALEQKKGWFSWLSSDDKQEHRFRLHVEGNDNSSRVSIVGDKGEPMAPDLAKAILTRLQEQLH